MFGGGGNSGSSSCNTSKKDLRARHMQMQILSLLWVSQNIR